MSWTVTSRVFRAWSFDAYQAYGERGSSYTSQSRSDARPTGPRASGMRRFQPLCQTRWEGGFRALLSQQCHLEARLCIAQPAVALGIISGDCKRGRDRTEKEVDP